PARAGRRGAVRQPPPPPRADGLRRRGRAPAAGLLRRPRRAAEHPRRAGANVSAPVDRIFVAFESNGAEVYLGEPVTLKEHMLQSAAAAEAEGAGDYLVAAALLHDIGHLLHDGPEDAAELGIDTAHEEVGFHFLEQHFPPAVVDPVRL